METNAPLQLKMGNKMTNVDKQQTETQASEINVGVAYADPDQQVWLRFKVPKDSTVHDAIHLSELLNRFPQIDLNIQKVGIFGRFVKLDTVIKEGDRVEIYCPIIADPKTVRRRKHNGEGANGSE